MADYATVNDVITLFRPLSSDEQTRCSALIPVVSNALRVEAMKAGKDLDNMVVASPALASVAKGVVVDIVARTLNTSTTSEPMSQITESALGYSISGTYAIPGGGVLQILRNDIKKLGLKRQRVKVIDLCSEE